MAEEDPGVGWSDSVADHRARYRRRIIDAAAALTQEHGLAGLTMAGLAERAGIGRATLYKYFPDIEHVLMAHLETEFSEFTAELHRRIAQESEPLARMRAYVETTLHYFASQQHRTGSASFSAGSLSPKVESSLGTHLSALHEPLHAVLTDGVASGAFRADLDPRMHAWLVFALLGGMRQPLMAGAMPPEAAIEAVWGLLMDGLRGQ